MTLTIPLWTLFPAALALVGLWLLTRPATRGATLGSAIVGMMGDTIQGIAGLACIVGAALFMLGRWLA